MFGTQDLTETQWQIAHAIAQSLVKNDTDVNELSKTIAYLRAYTHRENAGAKFFDYLKTLVRNGRQIGHSRQTSTYYESINTACTQYLKGYQNDAGAMLQILGWTSRLMRYYKNAGPIGEIKAPVVQSVRQVEIAEVKKSQSFAVDQTLEANVTSIKGNKVTYEILGAIKLTEREPRKAGSLVEGQVVRVKIIALKEDGNIKSVKCTE